MKVDFMIIGAARSATTSLSNILALHPDICFSDPKEPQFFSDTGWRNKLEQYHDLFKKKAALYGEGSTNYSKYPAFNTRIYNDIFEYNPDMKFIYIMRHPVDRIISHYNFAVERGYTEKDINTSIQEDPNYINISKYHMQIRPYLDLFGSDQVHFILFEDFVEAPQKVLDDVYEFLEIKPELIQGRSHANKSRSGVIRHKKYDHPKTMADKFKKGIHILERALKPKSNINVSHLSPETKRLITNALREDIKQLEELLQRDFSSWLD